MYLQASCFIIWDPYGDLNLITPCNGDNRVNPNFLVLVEAKHIVASCLIYNIIVRLFCLKYGFHMAI